MTSLDAGSLLPGFGINPGLGRRPAHTIETRVSTR